MEAFEENIKHSLVKGVNRAVEALLSNAASQDLDFGQVDENRLTTDFVQSFKHNGWTSGSDMPLENVHTFLEFFMYMILINGKCRRSRLSLTYKPTDELHNFATKIKTKLREMDGLTASGMVAALPNSGDDNVELFYAAGTASDKQTSTCTHCQRVRHTVNKCYIRLKSSVKHENRSCVWRNFNATPE